MNHINSSNIRKISLLQKDIIPAFLNNLVPDIKLSQHFE